MPSELAMCECDGVVVGARLATGHVVCSRCLGVIPDDRSETTPRVVLAPCVVAVCGAARERDVERVEASRWPSILAAVPSEGDVLLSEDGTAAYVLGIAHAAGLHGLPFIHLYLGFEAKGKPVLERRTDR